MLVDYQPLWNALTECLTVDGKTHEEGVVPATVVHEAGAGNLSRTITHHHMYWNPATGGGGERMHPCEGCARQAEDRMAQRASGKEVASDRSWAHTDATATRCGPSWRESMGNSSVVRRATDTHHNLYEPQQPAGIAVPGNGRTSLAGAGGYHNFDELRTFLRRQPESWRCIPWCTDPPPMIPLMAVVTSLSFATTLTCARSSLTHCSGPPRFRGGVPVLYQEVEEEQERGFPLPFLQRSVPKGQQPSQELDALRRQAFAKWPESDEYNSKMQGLYFFISLIFSLPVSFVTFDQLPQELPQLLIAANIGTLGFLVLFVGRLRLAWAEVSTRLKAKTTYYESNQRGNLARKEREASSRLKCHVMP